MHFLGLEGMPRRVFTYDPQYTALNVLASIGAFILAFATLPFLANVWLSLRSGKVAGKNPWRALTLEWTTDRRRQSITSRALRRLRLIRMVMEPRKARHIWPVSTRAPCSRQNYHMMRLPRRLRRQVTNPLLNPLPAAREQRIAITANNE
jgi:heme/copper-type cytochrome/quinol oxidase subunit 1